MRASTEEGLGVEMERVRLMRFLSQGGWGCSGRRCVVRCGAVQVRVCGACSAEGRGSPVGSGDGLRPWPKAPTHRVRQRTRWVRALDGSGHRPQRLGGGSGCGPAGAGFPRSGEPDDRVPKRPPFGRRRVGRRRPRGRCVERRRPRGQCVGRRAVGHQHVRRRRPRRRTAGRPPPRSRLVGHRPGTRQHVGHRCPRRLCADGPPPRSRPVVPACHASARRAAGGGVLEAGASKDDAAASGAPGIAVSPGRPCRRAPRVFSAASGPR